MEHFPALAHTIERLEGAIPSPHVHNHVTECQYKWAFKYMPHSGETYGELIETTWAEQNQSAGSTKEMNEGHRHESLDAAFNFWNWSKYIRMSKLCFFLKKTIRNLIVLSCHPIAPIQSRSTPLGDL